MNTALIEENAAESKTTPALKTDAVTLESNSISKDEMVKLLMKEIDFLQNNYIGALQKNAELRTMLKQQQEVINTFYKQKMKLLPAAPVMSTALPEVHVKDELPAVVAAPEKENVIPLKDEHKTEILSADALKKRIGRLIRKRTRQHDDTLTQKANFLFALYACTEGMTPENLFAQCGLTRITGFRYVAFFKSYDLLYFRPQKQNNGIYKISGNGRKFVEGKAFVEDDLEPKKFKLMVHH